MMLNFHKKNNSCGTLALRKAKNINSFSGYASLNHLFKIEEFIEKPDANKIQHIKDKSLWENSGIYVLEPEILKYIKKGFSDFAKDIFPELISLQKKILGFDMDSFYFREVGQIERYYNAKKEIESGAVKLAI
jgi:mannose-1-phosphate guanylyltransferase/phosphomannomutase